MGCFMRSRVSKGFRVVVPRDVRKGLGLVPGDFLVWEVLGGYAVVRPEKKRKKGRGIEDIVGLISVGGDDLVSKKEIQRDGS